MKKIYISVLNYNGTENTKECLRSLDKMDRGSLDVTIVVVDNNSKKQFSKEDIKLNNLKLDVIQSSINTGFAGGHNIGIAHALDRGADAVIILNNDTYVDSHMVVNLVKTAQNNKDAGIVAPKIYFAKGHEFHKDRYTSSELGKVIWYAGGTLDLNNVLGKNRGVDEVDTGQYETTEQTDLASGCCMLIKKEVLDSIGSFDERYFLYYEDTDLCQRVKQANYKIYYEPKSILWHKNAGSTGGSGSPLQDYYIARNRMLFGFTYATKRTKFALVREGIKILLTGRPWQKIGIRDFYLRKFGKGSYKP